MSGKVALVTGASSGIGKLTAIALMRAGYDLVVVGRRQELLDDVAALGAEYGVRALAAAADVADPASVKALFATVRDTFGRLDLLFNNAGTNTSAVGIEDLAFEDWRTVMATNLDGVFLCTRAAVAMMKAQDPQGGRIINNGSVSSVMPRPNSAPYTASKHAVTGLTKCTALDGRKYNIACGQIDVGNADTDMGGRMKAGVTQADGAIRPEPVMDAQHVADAVVAMAALPLSANVLSMTIMASAMPFVGRG